MLDTERVEPAVNCWMFSPPDAPPKPPCFILLGRYGDLIQMLPCFREIHERTGQRPVVVVSSEFASVFEGVSYVVPYPLHEHWWQGIPHARRIAENKFGGGSVLQWWNEDPEHAKMIAESARGDFVLQCHAQNWGVDIAKWPNYGTSMASRCGFTLDEWVHLPLVFDQRDAAREQDLANRVIGPETRPIILYNFTGVSGAFPFSPEIMGPIRQQYRNVVRFIDLGKIRAYRIYDLLGLYDRARGLITIDTATLHLAPASKIEYVGFTIADWRGSVPKGNCVLHLKYNRVREKLQDIFKQVARWTMV